MRNFRKLGADLGQSLLYSAFALIIITVVLGISTVVNNALERKEDRQTIAVISAEMMARSKLIEGKIQPLSNEEIISFGAKPNTSGMPVLNSGGVIYNPRILNNADPFGSGYTGYGTMVILWPENTEKQKNTCKTLSNGMTTRRDVYTNPNTGALTASDTSDIVDTGPLGSNYSFFAIFCGDDYPYQALGIHYGGTGQVE